MAYQAPHGHPPAKTQRVLAGLDKDKDLAWPAGDNNSSEHTVFVQVVMLIMMMTIMIFSAHLHAPHISDAVVPPR